MQHHTCESCQYWLRNSGAHGECRRHAPHTTLVGYTDKLHAEQPATIWPATIASDWCGEYAPVAQGSASVHPLPRRRATGETHSPPAAGGESR